MTRKLLGLVLCIFLACVLVASLSGVAIELLVQNAGYRGDESPLDLETKIHYVHLAQSIPAPFRNSYEKELEGDLLLRQSEIAASTISKYTFQKQAIEAYRESIRMEPAKAILWAKLALGKSMVNEFDKEFYQAFDNAIRYGGWELETNRIIVWIGLTHMQTLRTESLIAVKESVQRLYSLKPSYLINLASQVRGGLHVACIWTSDKTPLLPVCRKELRNYQH